jgi:hypothetical protein
MTETVQSQGLDQGFGGARALFGAVADTDSFRSDFAQLTEAGALTCLLVDPPMALALLRAHAVGSSGLAATYLGVLDEFTRGLEAKRSRRHADGCLACESGAFFRRHRPAIIAVLAAEACPEACIVAGICGACARRAGWPDRPWKSSLLSAMEPPLRRLWPHLRLAAVHPVTGTA